MPKKVVLLGATGSIGSSSLDVIRNYREEFELIAVSGRSQHKRLQSIIEEFSPRYVGLPEPADWIHNYTKIEFVFGQQGLDSLASLAEADIVVMALSGLSGLSPTLQAILSQKHLLSANKEAIVCAGALLMDAVRAGGAELLPVDSEHNAIHQCLVGAADRARDVRRLVLTASGGPFRTRRDLSTVTPDEAVAHPNWVMGRKISVDSATLMNKGLEVIEAHHLFRLPRERIEVVIHPQSVIHSMVEYVDGSVLAQLGNPDMRTPIAHALGYPERIESGARALDFFELQALSFADSLQFN